MDGKGKGWMKWMMIGLCFEARVGNFPSRTFARQTLDAIKDILSRLASFILFILD